MLFNFTSMRQCIFLLELQDIVLLRSKNSGDTGTFLHGVLVAYHDRHSWLFVQVQVQRAPRFFGVLIKAKFIQLAHDEYFTWFVAVRYFFPGHNLPNQRVPVEETIAPAVTGPEAVVALSQFFALGFNFPASDWISQFDFIQYPVVQLHLLFLQDQTLELSLPELVNFELQLRLSLIVKLERLWLNTLTPFKRSDEPHYGVEVAFDIELYFVALVNTSDGVEQVPNRILDFHENVAQMLRVIMLGDEIVWLVIHG